MESQNKDDINIRSEEILEILSTPPQWLVRWGTLAAFAALVLLGWVGYWVKYPDMVAVEVIVSSAEPIQRLNPKENVYIDHIRFQSEDTVRAGEAVIVFRSQADFSQVYALSDMLKNVNVPTENDSAILYLTIPKSWLIEFRMNNWLISKIERLSRSLLAIQEEDYFIQFLFSFLSIACCVL